MPDHSAPDAPVPPATKAEEVERELEAIQPALRAYVGSLIGSIAEVADVVQETNLLIWDKRGDYQSNSNFKAFAFKTAYWKVMSFRRDRARAMKRNFNEQLLQELAEDARALYEHGTDKRRDALTTCLRQLPAEHQALLYEHYVDEVSLTEVALRTRRKPSALHKTISRIRVALRQCVNGRLDLGNESH